MRGVPEIIEGDQIQREVTTLFNSIVGKPPHTFIDFERIHRALRPKGRDTDPPRDIICCMSDFKLKEEILNKARGQRLYCGETPVQLYQDLSGITLQHRRDLKPLLEALRSRDIRYKWKFPFCLAASNQGRNASLRVPEDLPRFCETLGLPPISVPDWYAPYRRSVGRRGKPPETPMETQATRFRRTRSPSNSRLPQNSPGAGREQDQMIPPVARRARRDHIE